MRPMPTPLHRRTHLMPDRHRPAGKQRMMVRAVAFGRACFCPVAAFDLPESARRDFGSVWEEVTRSPIRTHVRDCKR